MPYRPAQVVYQYEHRDGQEGHGTIVAMIEFQYLVELDFAGD